MVGQDLIKLIDVHKTFGSNHVHRGMTLDIKKGGITVVIGPSGTGKSILLKQMMGLLKPDSGKIIVEGVDITEASDAVLLNVRKKFGLLFQNAALFDSMSVYENVAFPLREHTKFSEKNIAEIVDYKLKLVGLTGVDEKYPAELSGGMRKRVGLARSLTLEPDIMLYDEPTTGLDPIMTDVVDDLIYDTQHKLKITSVVISHDISSVFKIADYIAMIYEGRVVLYGTPDEFEKTTNPYVRQFLSGSKDGPIKVY